MTPRQAAVLGALTADAASLGLHWLYDAGRLRALQLDGPLAFRSPDPASYAGVAGYFAHAGKQAGDLSPYGEGCRQMLSHLARWSGVFQRQAYQQDWLACFGPGGTWVGYADRPTRRTVVRLLSCPTPEQYPAVSGVDDDQLPALECVPALVACHHGDLDSLLPIVQQAVAVTHDDPVARDAAHVCALALHQVVTGGELSRALAHAAAAAGPVLKALLVEALAMPTLDPQAASARFGMPCHLPQGLPVLFHIAMRAGSFQEAVEANILAGGDSCGRSLLLGALCAADAAVRDATTAIPTTWTLQIPTMPAISADLSRCGC
ncbi:MAG: hypothetical protein RIS90_1927 [Pseudomonadota bacterium]